MHRAPVVTCAVAAEAEGVPGTTVPSRLAEDPPARLDAESIRLPIAALRKASAPSN